MINLFVVFVIILFCNIVIVMYSSALSTKWLCSPSALCSVFVAKGLRHNVSTRALALVSFHRHFSYVQMRRNCDCFRSFNPFDLIICFHIVEMQAYIYECVDSDNPSATNASTPHNFPRNCTLSSYWVCLQQWHNLCSLTYILLLFIFKLPP